MFTFPGGGRSVRCQIQTAADSARLPENRRAGHHAVRHQHVTTVRHEHVTTGRHLRVIIHPNIPTYILRREFVICCLTISIALMLSADMPRTEFSKQRRQAQALLRPASSVGHTKRRRRQLFIQITPNLAGLLHSNPNQNKKLAKTKKNIER